MFKKGHKLNSILKGKCPQCHQGDFFTHNFTLHPAKIIQIHKNCNHCNLKYMLEPSFFYGAMYVNYALTVAVIVTSFVVAKVIIDLEVLESFAVVGISSIISSPFTLRLSRILWINMFVNYKEEFVKKND